MDSKVVQTADSLIMEMVRLFAFVAKADGNVSKEEIETVREYLTDNYPDEFAKELQEKFLLYCKGDAGKLKDTCTEINNKYKIEDKLFLVYKILEFASVDGLSAEVEVIMKTIKTELNLHTEDFDILYNICTKGQLTNEQFNRKDNIVEVYPANMFDRRLKDIFIIIKIKSRLFFFSGTAPSSIDDHIYASQTLVNIENARMVLIRERYFQTQFFKSAIKYKGNRIGVYLSKDNSIRYEIENITNAVVFFEFGETLKLHISDQRSVTCNGEQEGNTPWYRIVPSDSFFIHGHGYYVQDVIINILNNSVFKSNLLTIGNSFIHDYEVKDNIDEEWSCEITHSADAIVLKDKNCPYKILINNAKYSPTVKISPNDVVIINNIKIQWVKERDAFKISSTVPELIEIKDLYYAFADKKIGIDHISLQIKRGELVAVMGPSGSGKSTFMNVLVGNQRPTSGEVLIDQINLHDRINDLNGMIAYAPQDDLLFENLTVYENLKYNSLLRHAGQDLNHEKIVYSVLKKIDLVDKKNTRVGDPSQKFLSGGERKRLNIGLELLDEKEIYFFDEPTSGLSSKDSENVINVIYELSRTGKIVFVVIHQPSQKILDMFDKIVLLDRGGKLIFNGSPKDIYPYFEQFCPASLRIGGAMPQTPEILLDVVEQPMCDLDNRPLSLRKYSPDHWQKSFSTAFTPATIVSKGRADAFTARSSRHNLKDKLTLLKTLFQRNFTNKLRDKSNVIISFMVPPLLGMLVSFILHYSNDAQYTLYGNKHLKTFIFLSVIIAIFLGITNSIEEVIRDRFILLREKKLNVNVYSYLLSKVITLLIFSVIQCCIYLAVSFLIFQIKELYLNYLVIMILVSLVGNSIGLFVGSFKSVSLKAVTNLVPILLIPQIIFGGALIIYEDMNKQLTVIHNNPIPEVCLVIPSRWGFEALLVEQGNHNSYDAKNMMLSEKRSDYSHILFRDDLIKKYSLELGDPQKAQARYATDSIATETAYSEHDKTCKDVYGNKDIAYAVNDANDKTQKLLADSTQNGKMFLDEPLFASRKRIPFTKMDVYTPVYNSAMLLIIAFAFLLLTTFNLKKNYFYNKI